MVYLSLLSLNPRSRRAQSEIRDPYQMHRTLSKGFEQSDTMLAQARCLFRVEEGTSEDVPVIVQACAAPNWDLLLNSGKLLNGPPIVKQVNPVFKTGQVLAFRLRANPSVARNGKRTGLYKEEEQLSWLDRKSELSGFRLCSVRLISQGQVQGRKADMTIALSAALFDGVLEVQDIGLFKASWESGIGAGKGFGFGLLSVAQVAR